MHFATPILAALNGNLNVLGYGLGLAFVEALALFGFVLAFAKS